MNIHVKSTPTPSGPGHAGRKTVLAVVGGFGVVGAALFGVSLRDDGGSSSTAVGPAPAVTGPASDLRNAAQPSSVLYLVGSDEEATYLRAAQEDADRIRAAGGELLLRETVVVVRSEAEADVIRSAVVEAESIRFAIGEPPFEQTVIDLR